MDAVVQSTDKNFMVPVGGSVVAAGPGKAAFVDAVNAAYPGRASAAPMLDLLMTLLFWGKEGWEKVLNVRFLCSSLHPLTLTYHTYNSCPCTRLEVRHLMLHDLEMLNFGTYRASVCSLRYLWASF